MYNQDLLSSTNTPLDALEASLRGLGARSEAITMNLANVSTTGYKRREVFFEKALQDKLAGLETTSLATTNAGHLGGNTNTLPGMEPTMSINDGDILTNGNNVDIDREMLELSKTGLRHKAISKITRRHLDGLKGIIAGT